MKVIDQSYDIWGLCPTGKEESLEWIERGGRICWRTEDKIEPGSAIPFVKRVAEGKGHKAILEMSNVILVSNGFYAIDDYVKIYSDLFSNSFITTRVYEGLLYLGGNVRAFMEHFGWDSVEYFWENMEAIGHFRLITDIEEIPNELKAATVEFRTSRIVTHELVRHRPCSFLQECVAADEIVQSFDGCKKWSMERLYEIFAAPNCGLARDKIRIRTKDEHDEIVPSKIVAVKRSGKKRLFKITTVNGRELKTSEEHIYFTETGEKRLKDIKIGDRVWVDGKTVNREWLQKEYLTKNRQRKDIAAEIGMSDAWLGKVIKSYGLQKPKTAYPNRKAGHGNLGMHSSDEKKRISERMSGGNNHRWVGDQIKDGHGRAIGCYDLSGKKCKCGKNAKERHHIDRDSTNNHPSNIELCCVKCHKARHFRGAKIAFLDIVVSIEPCGTGTTYDLEVEHPSHNFVVNGMVVHNSQRYVRYDGGMEFIKPSWYKLPGLEPQHLSFCSFCRHAEDLYKQMLKSGKMSPQDSRHHLPNATATTIALTARLPQWQHIFNLRDHPAADPNMRIAMEPVHASFVDRGWVV